MTPQERERLQQWAENWRVASERIERLRLESLSRIDLVAAIESFSDVLEYCRGYRRPRPDSGLIEQQRLFQKLRL
jgi:hypothetical protein